MNELTKTAVFLLIAITLVSGAYLTRPITRDFKAEEMLGTVLFPQFTNPLEIKSLEIVRLNALGEQNNFRIAEVNGIWSIPSHDNYPADARDQMGRVAEALTNLMVLEVIPPDGSGIDSVAFQSQYGVLDPTGDTAMLGESVGIKITIGGDNNATLVDLIVGRVVDQQHHTEHHDGAMLRYVRISGQTPVYVVNIDPSQFSTNFDQWIERNLLDISTFDIKEFFVDQYSFSIELALTGLGMLQEIPKASFIGDITLGYDASAIGSDKWSLVRWMTFEGQELNYTEQELGANRELNTETLDSMVSALNDLRIVNVLKKPASLSEALRKETAFDNIELDTVMQQSMRRTGFWLVELPDLRGKTQSMKTQLLSNDGDMQFRLQDGIVYKLRFGALTGTESEINTEDETHAVPNGEPAMGANRYLFITAEFDPAIIPVPELREIPEDENDENADERESIQLANQREQERYEAELARGKRRAAELSDRFADWYYVISEDVYRNIHLTETNLFRVSESLPMLDLPMLDLPVLDLPVLEPATEDF